MTYKKITIQHHEIKTQRQAIMWHLLTEKTCTSMEVWEKYKITRLSSIIHNLRNEGYNIETIDVKFRNMFGGSGIYARYKYHEPDLIFCQSKLF